MDRRIKRMNICINVVRGAIEKGKRDKALQFLWYIQREVEDLQALQEEEQEELARWCDQQEAILLAAQTQ